MTIVDTTDYEKVAVKWGEVHDALQWCFETLNGEMSWLIDEHYYHQRLWERRLNNKKQEVELMTSIVDMISTSGDNVVGPSFYIKDKTTAILFKLACG